ncbi:hypothetical protein DL89DRAFT_265003, partial [Linderina pennispora]
MYAAFLACVWLPAASTGRHLPPGKQQSVVLRSIDTDSRLTEQCLIGEKDLARNMSYPQFSTHQLQSMAEAAVSGTKDKAEDAQTTGGLRQVLELVLKTNANGFFYMHHYP